MQRQIFIVCSHAVPVFFFCLSEFIVTYITSCGKSRELSLDLLAVIFSQTVAAPAGRQQRLHPVLMTHRSKKSAQPKVCSCIKTSKKKKKKKEGANREKLS